MEDTFYCLDLSDDGKKCITPCPSLEMQVERATQLWRVVWDQGASLRKYVRISDGRNNANSVKTSNKSEKADAISTVCTCTGRAGIC